MHSTSITDNSHNNNFNCNEGWEPEWEWRKKCCFPFLYSIRNRKTKIQWISSWSGREKRAGKFMNAATVLEWCNRISQFSQAAFRNEFKKKRKKIVDNFIGEIGKAQEPINSFLLDHSQCRFFSLSHENNNSNTQHTTNGQNRWFDEFFEFRRCFCFSLSDRKMHLNNPLENYCFVYIFFAVARELFSDSRKIGWLQTVFWLCVWPCVQSQMQTIIQDAENANAKMPSFFVCLLFFWRSFESHTFFSVVQIGHMHIIVSKLLKAATILEVVAMKVFCIFLHHTIWTLLLTLSSRTLICMEQ